MNGAAESDCEFRIGDGLRRGQIQRASQSGRVLGEQNGGNRVSEADPTHPLATAAELSAQAQPEQRQHFGQCAACAEDCSEAQMDHSNAGLRGGKAG